MLTSTLVLVAQRKWNEMFNIYAGPSDSNEMLSICISLRALFVYLFGLYYHAYFVFDLFFTCG